jgi:hypothetical protein
MSLIVEALLIAVYLGNERLLIDIRDTINRTPYLSYTIQLVLPCCLRPPRSAGACPAEPSAVSAQLNLYEPANRNRNAAYSQHLDYRVNRNILHPASPFCVLRLVLSYMDTQIRFQFLYDNPLMHLRACFVAVIPPKPFSSTSLCQSTLPPTTTQPPLYLSLSPS